MIVRKDLELEITFESPRDDKEPVTYRFPLNECGRYILYVEDKPHMDFIGWIDTVLTNRLVKYPAYYDRCTKLVLGPDEKVTPAYGKVAYEFFTSLLDYAEDPVVNKAMEHGQPWFQDERRMVIEHGLSNLERLEDLNENTRAFGLVLKEYRDRQPIQYNFYRDLILRLDDSNKKKVLDQLYPDRIRDRKERRIRLREERIAEAKARAEQREFARKRKAFQKEFDEAMSGVYSFAEFLMSNTDVIKEFDADSQDGFCHGYINTNSGESWDLRYGFRNFNKFEQYSETNVTNECERLERLLKYGFHNCFSNTNCNTMVIHRELGKFEDYRKE